jgi:signal transduction histidine kinase/CheY-like chemotaxis protein
MPPKVRAGDKPKAAATRGRDARPRPAGLLAIGEETAPAEHTLRSFCYAGLAVSTGLGTFWFLDGSLGMAIGFYCLALGFLFSYNLRHRHGVPRAAFMAALMPAAWILSTVFLTGGPAGTRGHWLFLPPLLALLLFRTRVAVLYAAGYCAAVMGLWLLHLTSYPFPQLPESAASDMDMMLSSVSAFVALVVVTLVFALEQQRARRGGHTVALHLESLLNGIPEPIVAVEAGSTAYGGHHILYTNAAMERLLGDDATGGTLERLSRRERLPGLVAAFQRQFEQVARRDGPVTNQVELGHEGERRVLELSSQRLGGTDSRQIVTVARDLTDQLDTERLLAQSAKMAAIGQLVAGVAHELNNPIAAIKATAALLETDLDGPHRGDARTIGESAERAARIVRGLLGFARELPPERVATDLNEVVIRCLRGRASVSAPHIRVTPILAADLPATIADPAQMEQVVTNLLNNAELAIADGPRPADGEVVIRTARRGDRLVLEIEDNGRGIPETQVARIFDPFFTTRKIGAGTGLGLAITHGIVAQHGGAIRVDSSEGHGTTFTVEIPLQAPVGGVTRPRHGDPGEPARRAVRRVLLVDDENALRNVVGRYLRRRGHEVAEAETAERAIELAREESYDLVLLDVKMPGMNGDELFRLWQAENPRVAGRVVFATGDTVSPTTHWFLADSGRPVLEKPYDLKHVARLVEEG